MQNVHFGLLDFHGECLHRGFGGAAFGRQSRCGFVDTQCYPEIAKNE